MNTQAINEAFNRVSKRRSDAVATYDKHMEEVEKNIPEIVHLNSAIANTSRNIIVTSLTKGIDIKSKINEIKRANEQVQLRTAELLKSKGYPDDYLEIKYHCPKCCDTGYFNDDYCDCINLLVKQISAESVNKNSNLKLCTFDTFNLKFYSNTNTITIRNHVRSEYSIMEEIFKDCKEYVEKFPKNSPSVIMYGRTGLGKSHLSLAIARGIMDKGYNVIYNSALDLFNAIEKEKFSRFNNYENDTLESVLNADLLIIDDLGIEVDNKFYKSVLYNIINTRYIRALPIIINTNLTIEELQNKYDERITSRIQVFQAMEFFGKDVRGQLEYQKKDYISFKTNTL